MKFVKILCNFLIKLTEAVIGGVHAGFP